MATPAEGDTVSAETTTLAAELERYLRQLASAHERLNMGRRSPAYGSMEAFVLAHGRRWEPHPRPVATLGRERECFKNAADLVLLRMRDSGLVYVEGYAARARVPFPVAHAWVADAAGRAIELTWRLEEGEGVTYFGVPFRERYLVRALMRSKRYGLLDRPEHGWPLLTGRDAAEEAVLPWPTT
jgi:hypothetical protein